MYRYVYKIAQSPGVRDAVICCAGIPTVIPWWCYIPVLYCCTPFGLMGCMDRLMDRAWKLYIHGCKTIRQSVE